eukprot:1137260-Pelagomonas_calceolata.AAC.12
MAIYQSSFSACRAYLSLNFVVGGSYGLCTNVAPNEQTNEAYRFLSNLMDFLGGWNSCAGRAAKPPG